MKILTDPRSGSYQGITSSRNRFGQYVRTRAIPVQPRTPRQTANRAFLTIGSSAWRTLTDPQRTAWNDYAAQITRSDSLGSGYSPTGAALYSGSAIIAQGSVPTNPPVDLPEYSLAISLVAYVDPTPGPEALNFSLGNTNADNFFYIETSGPVSPGLTSAAAVRRWRNLPADDTLLFPNEFGMSSATVDAIAQYKRLFPSPLTGQTIWFRFRELAFPGGGTVGITNKLFTTYRFVVP